MVKLFHSLYIYIDKPKSTTLPKVICVWVCVCVCLRMSACVWAHTCVRSCVSCALVDLNNAKHYSYTVDNILHGRVAFLHISCMALCLTQ